MDFVGGDLFFVFDRNFGIWPTLTRISGLKLDCTQKWKDDWFDFRPPSCRVVPTCYRQMIATSGEKLSCHLFKYPTCIWVVGSNPELCNKHHRNPAMCDFCLNKHLFIQVYIKIFFPAYGWCTRFATCFLFFCIDLSYGTYGKLPGSWWKRSKVSGKRLKLPSGKRLHNYQWVNQL